MIKADPMKLNREGRALVVGTWVIPLDGGRPKTMRLFAKALDCPVASFTADRVGEAQKSAFPEVVHASTSLIRGLGSYGFATKENRSVIEDLAARSDLLSCHVMFRYHANWVKAMASQHGLPYWLVPHGQLDPYVFTYGGAVKRTWMRFFGGRMLKDAAHVIFATERERLKAKWIYDGPNTRVIHWPVELMDVTQKDEARKEARRRLGMGQGDRLLIFFGRVHEMKRPLETIRAFAAANCPGLHLALIGPYEGISEATCEELSAQLGVSGNVHVLGPQYGRDKEIFVLGSDGFISLSIRENFGHTAAESLSAGNPVILSPGNDLAGELHEYGCGWFLRTDDLAEATGAIREFAATSDEKLCAMGMSGRSFIAKECSFDVFQSKILELKQEALEKKRS